MAVATEAAGRRCRCDAGAVDWIHDMGTCEYDGWGAAAFVVGLASIAVWAVAQVPQFVENMKNRSSDALSAWFLLQWLLGDSANLLGCLLTGTQQPTETYTAMYFIFADLLMITQYTFYALNDRLAALPVYATEVPVPTLPPASPVSAPPPEGRPPRPHAPPPARRVTTPQVLYSASAFAALGALGTLQKLARSSADAAATAATNATAAAATMLAADALSPPPPASPSPIPESHMCGFSDHPPWMQQLGLALGWASSAFYLCSRFSQLWLICVERKGEAKGLSPWLFLLAVIANGAYGASILMHARGNLPASQIPWVLGSLGTMVMDVTLFGLAVRARFQDKGNIAPVVDVAAQEPLLV